MRTLKSLVKKLLNWVGLNITLLDKTNPNKIIKRKVGNFTLLMNYGHIYNSKFLARNYDKNLPRLAQKIKLKYPDFSIIDIGANIGDTVAMIKSVIDAPIICIEGDKTYYDILTKNIEQFENVKTINKFLGEKAIDILAKTIQTHGSLKIDTTLKHSNIQIETLDELVNKNPNWFLASKLLKIDTDGFDVKVLMGSIEFISNQKPVLFFEYSEQHLKNVGDDTLHIFEMLESLNYNYLIFYDHTGRFILSSKIYDKHIINHLHNYIANYNVTIPFLDIAAFHESDNDIFEEIKIIETQINRNTTNDLIYNA